MRPFQTDGCTLFPEGSYSHCCIVHDKDYWRGRSIAGRDEADNRFYQCIKKESELLAQIMYWGVRVGHYSPIKLEHKWGWGHTN